MTEKTQKIKRREINMLEGSLWDKILIYAFPLAATGILQQLFNAADIAVVGRFTGSMASLCMAAVGANTPMQRARSTCSSMWTAPRAAS